MSHDDYICFVTVTSMLIYVIIGILIPNTYFRQNYTEMSPINFCIYIYTCVLFITFTTMLSNRVIRRDLESAESALEFKRMFIRYISHEMRTPLNAATLGLKLLQENVSMSLEDEEKLETIRDIKESCDIAVNTLNELLMFDKLESGMLKLELEKCVPLDLIRNSVKPFHTQVKAWVYY